MGVVEADIRIAGPTTRDPLPGVAGPPRRRLSAGRIARATARGSASAAEWAFGLAAIVVGLAALASLPLAQFLAMGYLLEVSARVGRSGRLRDGFVGVRKAARVGGLLAGLALSVVPGLVVGSFARSAALIDPGGPIARGWRVAAVVVAGLTVAHVVAATIRGGRFRRFLWPAGNLWWIARRGWRLDWYAGARDGSWDFARSLRLPHYFRLGLVGFLGTLAWLIVPTAMIAAEFRRPLVGVAGVILLAMVVPLLPTLQVAYAESGRISALFSVRAARDRFRRAPWAVALALMALLIGSIPLYLLKIEMIPREAAWLPALVFVLFLAPARLLSGWAYARSTRRDRPRHWAFRWLGRLAIVPTTALYVLIVVLSQYTSWAGAASLYEQHAFLLPAPFLGF